MTRGKNRLPSKREMLLAQRKRGNELHYIVNQWLYLMTSTSRTSLTLDPVCDMTV